MALTKVTTGGITDATIATADIAADAITGAKIADDAVGAEHIEQLDADLSFADSVKAKFGAGNDLEIYHDGSNTRIANSTGDLKLQGGGDDILLQPVDTEIALKAVPNGAVELYHDNSKQLETQSVGIKVSGHVHATVTGSQISSGLPTGGDYLMFYHDGSNGFIQNGSGGIKIKDVSGGNIEIQATDGETSILCNHNGAVELYNDNVKQLSTRSDGIEIHAAEGGEAMLYLTADEGDDDNDKYRLVAQNGGDLVFQRHNGSAYSSELRLKSAGGIQANYQGSNKFETTSNGIAVTGYLTQSAPVSWMAYGGNSWTTISAGNTLHPYIFTNTAHNNGGHYSTTTGKFTCPVTGLYQMNYNIFTASATNQTSSATIEFYVKKNGNTISRLHNKKGYGNMGDDQQVVNLAFTEQFSANDEITLFVQAVTVDWQIYGGHTTFSGFLVG